MEAISMVQFVIFINLFFAPVLPLYVIYRKKKKEVKLTLELLFHYCIITAVNIPLAKLFIYLVKKMSGKFIPLDSGYYTIATLLPTFMFVIFNKFYETYPDHKSWKEKIVQRGIGGVFKELTPACLLMFVGCFMLFIFEPILMYATNMNDFWFDFRIIIWPIVQVFIKAFLTGTAVMVTIYNIDLLLSERLYFYKGSILTGFVIFFLAYLQGNWLDGKLPPLTGDEIIWEKYGKHEDLFLMFATAIIILVILIIVKNLGLNRAVIHTIQCAAIIFIMLFVSLIPVIVSSNAVDSKDSFASTWDNYNTVSENKNFLIFLLDTVDSEKFFNVMMDDPDFCNTMKDFTYYQDALSTFPHTRDSILNILTGSVNHNETNFLDYSSNAYNQSPLFKKLAENGYEINLYSTSISWGGKRNYNIENSTSIYDIDVDINDFSEQELKYILYKYLPYKLKRFSKIESLNFDTCKILNSGSIGYTWGNQANLECIMKNNTLDKQEENIFHFIHCEGVHTPYNMDKELNIIEGGTEEQKIAASLTLIKTYLQRLKDNNAYDNSVIVIMSDHGQIDDADAENYEQPYLFLRRCNPILFMKGINEKHTMLVSDIPVSYSDLQDAFCDLIDGKQSTELFDNLEYGRTRTVLWHIWTEEYHMVEYSTTGTAREPRRFVPTGNVYDLKE